MLSLLTLPLSMATSANPATQVYPIIKADKNSPFQIQLLDAYGPIKPHYHLRQKQILIIVEGQADVICDEEDPIELKEGDWVIINPGTIHSLFPKESARLFSIELPGIQYPEDVYYDFSPPKAEWSSPLQKGDISSLPEDYEKLRLSAGQYEVVELINGDKTAHKWSAALLDIKNSPKHFHKKGKELFIPLEGSLLLEVNGERSSIPIGEVIEILPEDVHQLRSEDHNPVRVLCFNFPSFDPTDMYLLDD